MSSREHSDGTIITKYGVDKYTVHLSGLANVRSQLLQVMNCTLRSNPKLHMFNIDYPVDLLLYSSRR